MKRRYIIIFIVSGVIAFSGCRRFGSAEKDRITFSHSFHINQGVECLICHDGIQTSETPGFGLPAMNVCAQCHAETEDSDSCTKCHTNPAAAKRLVLRTISLNFSHKAHIPRVNNDCTACHITNASSTKVEDDNIPPMNSCLQCHSATVRELRCSVCHTNLGSYELKPITHISHKGNFIKEHQEFARADVSVCAQCHQESYCSDCHAKTEGVKVSIKYPESEHRTFIHRGDWLSRHPLEARADQNRCLKCHDALSCRDCHEKSNAMPARSEFSGHPEGWLRIGDRNFHGRVARRDAALCASCHEAGSATNCIQCHRAGDASPNIHPLGFKSTLDKKKDEPCKRCHL